MIMNPTQLRLLPRPARTARPVSAAKNANPNTWAVWFDRLNFRDLKEKVIDQMRHAEPGKDRGCQDYAIAPCFH
jgi:hypothetical protein